MTKPPGVTDDAELRWSDHVLTEINWNDFDWPDDNDPHQFSTSEMTTSAISASMACAPAIATAIVTQASAEDDQCPF